MDRISAVPRPLRLWNRLGDFIRRQGLFRLPGRIWKGLTIRPFHRAGYIQYTPIDPDQPLPRCSFDLEIADLRSGDDGLLDRIVAIREQTADHNRAVLESRLRQGDRCQVALYEGRPVAYLWFRFGEFPVTYLGQKYQIGPDQVYYYDSYTLPVYRGQGIFPYLKAYSTRWLAREQGVRGSVGFVVDSNHASRAATHKLGAVPVLHLGLYNIFGIRFYYQSGPGIEGVKRIKTS